MLPLPSFPFRASPPAPPPHPILQPSDPSRAGVRGWGLEGQNVPALWGSPSWGRCLKLDLLRTLLRDI